MFFGDELTDMQVGPDTMGGRPILCLGKGDDASY